jgi:hypothetical protein
VGWSCLAKEIDDCVDECYVRKSLREVPDQTLVFEMVLLSEQPDVILKRQQPFQKLLGFNIPPHEFVIIRQPKTAC